MDHTNMRMGKSKRDYEVETGSIFVIRCLEELRERLCVARMSRALNKTSIRSDICVTNSVAPEYEGSLSR
jgi:hypothetical protein